VYETMTVRAERSVLLPQIRDFLAESDDIYPGIDRWWERRVLPGLATGERRCLVAFCDGVIAGLSISKHSRESAKFCTLRVRPGYQGQGIGQDLIRRTLLSFIEAGCREVYFTMNEGIAHSCIDFFKPYGFQMQSWLPGFYARGEDEMIYSASAKQISTALCTAVRATSSEVLLMSIRPEYAALMESGAKTVEFRRRFSERFDSGPALFYVTAPASEVRLAAHVSSVAKDHPSVLWERYRHLAGGTAAAFQEYFAGAATGFAIILDRIRRLARPVSLDAARRSCADFRPPQAYQFLTPAHPLVAVTSI